MKNIINTASRSFALQLMFADRGLRLRQSEIAKRLGVKTGTAYRILQTLAMFGFVSKDSGKRWGAATGLLPLAWSMREEVRILENSRRVIDALAKDRKISSKISIRSGDREITLMYVYPQHHEMMVGEMQIESSPLIAGTSAAALLCDEPDSVPQRIINAYGGDIPRAKYAQRLLAGMENIRRKGWHYESFYSNYSTGFYGAMSAPVRPPAGAVIAALTFLGRNDEFSRSKIPALSKLLLASARACSNSAFV